MSTVQQAAEILSSFTQREQEIVFGVIALLRDAKADTMPASDFEYFAQPKKFTGIEDMISTVVDDCVNMPTRGSLYGE